MLIVGTKLSLLNIVYIISYNRRPGVEIEDLQNKEDYSRYKLLTRRCLELRLKTLLFSLSGSKAFPDC